VYIEEISGLPPSVAEVETAIPAFIGYTASATAVTTGDLHRTPRRIRSLLEFETCYGKESSYSLARANIDGMGNFLSAEISNHYYLYDSLRLFYDNGGGDCYIVSVGTYKTTSPAVDREEIRAGVQAAARVDEPTILLFPDAAILSADDLAAVQQAALAQCGALRDRVAVLDLRQDDPVGTSFRDKIGTSNLKYGAAYTPWLRLGYTAPVRYAQVRDCVCKNDIPQPLDQLTTDVAILTTLSTLDQLLADDAALAEEIRAHEQTLYDSFTPYRKVIDGVRATLALCPPSGAIAGVYALVDRQRGVWKAPANVSLSSVIAPGRKFTTSEADALNVDAVSGKSINAIRAFAGKGTLVWGARTLAGNDNEWRYVCVRRFFNMVEESTRKSTLWVVFEPNDANTWAKVRAMIENYLAQKWREGALAGATPRDAYFVRCGLGVTMSAQDILQGRMNVEIGMAVVRPAEFIILKFSHKLQAS
jgi:phage tail sheath protein FI